MLEKPVVLVVEDEPIIRMETVQMVRDAGYAVLDAPNTDDAIAILEGRQDIHAVFTEIRVPGHLNGVELAHAIVKRWPLVRVVVTSGVPRADNFPADWSYVQKPYDGAQLAGALRALLAPRPTVAN
jgi:DNA-binding NtrC family response regulator